MLAKGLAGNGRYEIVQRLGAGASGIVYEARDRERRARVALKTLTRLDPSALYRFKREFRALADVTHPNLVRLHELVSEEDEWFFTMELVEGVEFLEYAWLTPAPPDAITAPATLQARNRDSPRRLPRVAATRMGAAGYDRVRAGLVQLASALEALHAAGKLHRDIKPSNVLVARGGRVVVVDFGIAKDLRERGMGATEADMVIGTPQYMAPEQAAAMPLTAAADWYSVGALLYATLTGHAPIEGEVTDVLAAKLREVPRPPRALVPGVPDDLDELCVRLLGIDPEKRARGTDILQRLDPSASALGTGRASSVGSGADVPPAAAFVGRSDVLASLRNAFATVERGGLALAFVQGTSGMGKSAIVRHFLDEIQSTAVVLAGQCFERESVPYKAFDSLIDALTQHLLRLRSGEQGALMPRDVAALARLFPVLDRVPAVAEAPRRTSETMDAQQLRARAFFALRDLLGRLGDRLPAVVFIDDMQWADADSAALLRELTAPPDPPRLLLILSFRGEDVSTSAALASLVDPEQGLAARREALTITLDALSPAEAKSLAGELLGGGEAGAALAARVASESGGNPFFVGELVRYVRSLPNPSVAEVRLGTVLRERLGALDAGALRLLQVVALAGRPIAQAVAFRAAALDGEASSAALAVLKGGSLVRAQGTRAGDGLECFHDRIREAAVASMDSEAARSRHADLAEVMIASGGADPEALFLHSHAAGMSTRACEYAIAAANKASLALAFDRAAQFHRFALELMPAADPRAPGLRAARGDALANAGRGLEAAEAYLAAALGADAARGLDLRCRAAAELLRSGRFDEGTDAVAQVLAEVGMRLPRSPAAALVLLVFWRAVNVLCGFRFRRREASQVPARDLTRVDVCWSVAAHLAFADVTLGAMFQQRLIFHALRCGEPTRVARALTSEMLYSSMGGSPAWNRTTALITRTRELADSVRDPRISALATASIGIATYLGAGRFARTLELSDEATAQFLDCTGVSWELAVAQLYGVYALVYLGRWDELGVRVDRLLANARPRGDLFTVVNCTVGIPSYAWLARDEPASVRRAVTDAMSAYATGSFRLEHYYEAMSFALADLYEGNAQGATDRMERVWRPLGRSLFLRVQALRIEANDVRARALLALASGRDGRERSVLLGRVRRIARALHGERVAWADCLALLLEGGAAHVGGQREEAARVLEEAASRCDATGMAIHAAAARYGLGIVGASEGSEGTERARALVEGCEAWMRAKAIRRPDRIVAVLAPAFSSRAPSQRPPS